MDDSVSHSVFILMSDSVFVKVSKPMGHIYFSPKLISILETFHASSALVEVVYISGG